MLGFLEQEDAATRKLFKRIVALHFNAAPASHSEKSLQRNVRDWVDSLAKDKVRQTGERPDVD